MCKKKVISYMQSCLVTGFCNEKKIQSLNKFRTGFASDLERAHFFPALLLALRHMLDGVVTGGFIAFIWFQPETGCFVLWV